MTAYRSAEPPVHRRHPMSEPDVRNLERLLETALRSVVIRHETTTTDMSLGEYRELLHRCRSSYDSEGRFRITSFHPDVEDTSVRDSLLNVIRRELAHYIVNDMLHSGSILIGGGLINGTPIDDVVQNLMRRTIADGPKIAAQAFQRCVGATGFPYCHFVLLTSVRLDHSVPVFDGISLLPLSEQPQSLPWVLPHMLDHYGAVDPLLSMVSLSVQKQMSPIFDVPRLQFRDPRRWFTATLRSQDAPTFCYRAFYQALSLACGASVRPTIDWDALLDYEIFDFRTVRGIGGSEYSRGDLSRLDLSHLDPFRRHEELDILLTDALILEAKKLYGMIVRLDPRVREKLDIPIERWMRSMEQQGTVDKIIDLGIALESLYLHGIRDELRFRFALRAAWHLASDPRNRTERFEVFKVIYDLRSTAVHEGRAKETVSVRGEERKIAEFVQEAQEHCREAITAVIQAGTLPEWDRLVLG